MLPQQFGNIMAGQWQVTKRYWSNSSAARSIGMMIGVLPGAGADIAAWVSYAMSKRFSKEPEKFGTGHVEGIVEATSATIPRSAGPGCPRWCSAFRATRSPRS